MRFPFGWHYCDSRSYDPFELGLALKKANDFTIEVRQWYFQLFWIPFFSMGWKWSIRKNDQLFELPADYKDAIRQREDLHVPSPWYTYTGLILVTLAGLCYVVNSKYVYWERHVDFRNDYISMAAGNMSRFQEPTTDDYYVLAAADGTEKYAHVNRVDERNIQLLYINDPSVHADRPAQVVNLFTAYAGRLRLATVHRADSLRLICREYEKRNVFAGIPLGNDDDKTWRIVKIIRMDGPIFKDHGYASHYANGHYSFCMNIENEGLPATITGIVPLEGDIEWIGNGLPLQARPEKRIAILGKGDFNKSYKAKIICTDDQGRKLQYLMEGRLLHNTFRKIEM